MWNSDDQESNKKEVQLQVIQILNRTNYSLNVVNKYKENIVHISASNNCIDVIKCILLKYNNKCLERKNAFGWTPLMQAIRNENMEMVKFLLYSGAIVNDFSFLGMSVLSLACAISYQMFDIIYNSCPSALEYATHDDINPLCIAALRNDKKLFSKLIYLGLNINKANALTHVMIKQSTVSEIATYAKLHLNSEDYWNDLSDIKDLLKNKKSSNKYLEAKEKLDDTELKTNSYSPKIKNQFIKSDNEISFNNTHNLYFNLNPVESDIENKSKNHISPILSYLNISALPMSPNIFVTECNPLNKFTKHILNITEKDNLKEIDQENQLPMIGIEDSIQLSPLILRRCKNKRPPNLKLRNLSNDSNATLSFTPQFSPAKSPNVPCDINEDNVFDESTPTPPKYETPPRGIISDPNTTKLIILLKRFGLHRHIPIFLEQEVDIELFLTLTNKDLNEIGIESKSERLILLSVINECKGSEL